MLLEIIWSLNEIKENIKFTNLQIQLVAKESFLILI